MNELLRIDATEAARRVRSGEASARALTEAALAMADATEPKVGAFLSLQHQQALARADQIDALVSRGIDPGLLAGVPVAIKDNIHIEGLATSCASRILGDFKAPFDAHVVARLREAGAIFVGKTNLDEFAMGSSCENSALKQTRNPWDPARVPGGSSGGSAACVAARSAWISLGSDTGGSIRLPASFCGVVGYKPTYGRVSRYGLVAFASSLDQIGPFSRSVRDSALALQAMAGHDPHDSTCSKRPVPDYTAGLRTDCKGLKVGVIREYLEKCPDASVGAAVQGSIERLRELGAEIVEVELPHAEWGISVYYVIASAEASSNLSRFDGVRYGLRQQAGNVIAEYFATRGAGFGPEVKRRIMLGAFALSAGHYEEFFGRAARVRTLIVEDYRKLFARCDLLALPCAPMTAFRAGEKSDPLSMYLCDIYTIPASLAGLPALSMPAGFDQGGLPIGIQLQAAPFADGALLSAAHALEQSLALSPVPSMVAAG